MIMPFKNQSVVIDSGKTMETQEMLTEKKLLSMPKKSYMNEEQLDFFKQKLLDMREEILAHTTAIMSELSETEHEFDELDIATNQEENASLMGGERCHPNSSPLYLGQSEHSP